LKKTGLWVSISSVLLVSAISSTSYAQNTPRQVSVTATAVSTAISYSEPAQNKKPALESVVTYLVTITNDSGNTINKVRYVPTFSAANSTSAPLAAVFIEDPGSPCTFDATATQGVVCQVGQVQAQSPTATFAIFFKSPLNPNEPLGTDLQPKLGSFTLGGTVYFAEGTTDDPSAPNSNAVMPPAIVTLGTTSATLVKSGVKKGGGSVFTGTGGVPTEFDKNASLLSVPALPSGYNFGFSKLDEAETTPACPQNIPCLATFGVTVTDKDGGAKLRFAPAEQTPPVPVTDPLTQYIVVTLRRDDTLFTGSIAKVNIYYTSDGIIWEPVIQCAQMPDPLFGVDRCIYDRRVLKASDPEVKADPSLKGVAQIKVLEKENGRLSW
jgi:hypothetical protein